MNANKMQTRTPNCLEANWLVTLALLPLFANTRHVTKCTENAALALSGRHLGSTRGAKVQNLSRSLRDVTFFRAATLWASQIGFGDDCHVYLPQTTILPSGSRKSQQLQRCRFASITFWNTKDLFVQGVTSKRVDLVHSDKNDVPSASVFQIPPVSAIL